MNTIVKCPQCGHPVDVENAIARDIQQRMSEQLKQEQDQWRQQQRQEQERMADERQKLEDYKRNEKEVFDRKLQEHLSREQQRIKDEMEAKNRDLISRMQAEGAERERQILDFQNKEADFLEKERQLALKQERADLEMKRVLAEKEEAIRADAERMANERTRIELAAKENEMKRRQQEAELELNRKLSQAAEQVRTEESLKQRELVKQLEDQKKLIEEMKKKSEQGSMQLQGEVQELLLEDILKQTFPYDRLEEVGKGVRGADVIQRVLTPMGEICGTILFESKRTQNFSADWIEKLKTDQRSMGAELAVIVTTAMPKDMDRFGFREGVWICSFAEVKSVVMILRDGLIRVQQAMKSRENMGDKMQLLYDYLTGTEFRQQVEAIAEGFYAMKRGLDKERIAMEKIWKEREKQIEKVLLNTTRMYGSVRGIAGSAVGEVKALELGDEPEELSSAS